MARPPRISTSFAALALALPIAAASCTPDPLKPDPDQAQPEVLTALRIDHGLPLVEGKLPGEARAWFLIDTGAGDYTLLDEKLTTSLRLKHDLVRDPLLPSINFSTKLAFLEVDGMGRKDLTAYVTDALSDRSELSVLGVPVQGVLGTGYFRGHCLWLDWGKGEFTAMHARKRSARQIPIPLRFGVGGDLHASIRVNGADAEALIDTGSGQTLVSQELADRAHVDYDRAKVAVHRETSIGAAAVRDGTLARLSLSSEEIAGLPVLVIERRLPNADLVLGTDVLSRYGVILDLADHPYLVLDPLQGRATEPPPANESSKASEGKTGAP
jgi:hypothetical protein